MKTARRGEPTSQQPSVLQRGSPRNAVSQVTDYCERGKQEFHKSAHRLQPPVAVRRSSPLADRTSLHPHFDLQLAVTGNLDSFAAFQVELQHCRSAPLQVPAVGQRESGVLAGHNVGQREATIAIALISAE